MADIYNSSSKLCTHDAEGVGRQHTSSHRKFIVSPFDQIVLTTPTPKTPFPSIPAMLGHLFAIILITATSAKCQPRPVGDVSMLSLAPIVY